MKNLHHFFILKTAKIVLALAVFWGLGISTAYSQTTRYVTLIGAGTMDGSSWANASVDFQIMMMTVLRLSCGSPAYNVGTVMDAPATDIVNTTRPQFGAIDMGAYEKADNCCGAKVGIWIN